MIVAPDNTAIRRSATGAETRAVSDAGGLRQFGASIETLAPGGRSSDRHWHSSEDEFLFVLEGCATVIEDEGAVQLQAGDAIGWPFGLANGHQVKNLTDAPLRYLIAGSRVAHDICTYCDTGARQINGADSWQVVGSGGEILRGGPLPPHLMNLPARWGKPHDPATRLARTQRAEGRIWVQEGPYRHPAMGAELGPYAHCILGDPAGLSQFGAHLERLPAGSASGFRHWHETEDEMVLMLEGEALLVEDHETLLRAGDVACWPAGRGPGHCLENRGLRPAIYLTLGTRLPRDIIHYPDHDLITHKDGTARRYTDAAGRPRQGEQE